MLGFADPYVILSDAARALPAQRLDALLRALVADLRRRPEIARVIDVRSLKDTCPPATDESEDALVCRAFTPGAGDLYVIGRSPGPPTRSSASRRRRRRWKATMSPRPPRLPERATAIDAIKLRVAVLCGGDTGDDQAALEEHRGGDAPHGVFRGDVR